MIDYKEWIAGKIIKTVEIDGFHFYITFTDDSKIEYDASDGGHSTIKVIGIDMAKGAKK